MLTTHADVVRCARDVGLQLQDEQRIALGVTLIQMAKNSESFGAVFQAERMIGDHGRALLLDAMREDEDHFEDHFLDTAIDTTHELYIDRHHPGAEDTAGDTRPRVLFASLRAAWTRLKAAERRASDSIWGDILGGISVVIIAVVLVISAGVLQ
ncbi:MULTISPECIES: hypothetical protein [unclassified Marinovum]|uniref:hypothetical protein n=1 Tax=unclassified Marinovum TaxID=2647166 RepID=UPI003EDBEE28